ncbi:multicopper oxidase domain-containing protein [Alsobacter sp. R-9]
MTETTSTVGTTDTTSADGLANGAVAVGIAGAATAAATTAASAAAGPGPFSGGLPDFANLSTSGPETYETYGCKVYNGSPPTPDWQTADVWFDRKFSTTTIQMWDGAIIPFWCFQDELVGNTSATVPSPLIRVTEGDMVHVRLSAAKNVHTIHHHGIEPTTFNDGVGHVSFEVQQYTYQWKANTPGTWIYHCHVNTPLHFEMGLYGAIVVDPKPVNGVTAVFKGGPTYDVEKIWAFDDVDPRWHTLDHAAGLCGEDVGLNVFQPKYFMINGAPSKKGVSLTKAAISARQGQKILIRTINAAYSHVRMKIEGLEATLVSVDGHPLNKDWNGPVTIPPMTEISNATAQRHELIIDLASAVNKAAIAAKPVAWGTGKRSFKVEFEFLEWVGWERHNKGTAYEGYVTTTIDIV